MSDVVFEEFPKIARLNRQCVISGKIDGTNAQVGFKVTLERDEAPKSVGV